MATRLSTRPLEKVVRGFSCHRRIQILDLLDTATEGMSMLAIARACRTDFKPISEHLGRLHQAGLITKRPMGRATMHEITLLGRKIIAFLRDIDAHSI